jgi:phosphoribosylaminoimidazolecarboxamide formyltransferase / IMP cyclohydrolase
MSTTDPTTTRRALLSVYDKEGLPELAQALHAAGVELISTGSTAGVIRDAGVPVTEVAAVTGFPEIMGGRVKTLHPSIHGGILADRAKPDHTQALSDHGITAIDLVVVNLYPFRQTVADPDVDPAQAIEMIDIGGPAMVRAAAKNHAHVGVVVDPADYYRVVEEIRSRGWLDEGLRRQLATKAFAVTAAYDADVTTWLASREQTAGDEEFPRRLEPAYRKAQDLRYGENPHQRAAYYVEVDEPWGLGSARQLHGKELSYNNLLDTDAAWALATDFTDPCIAIIKHTNPAGVAVAEDLAAAYAAALAGDPVSAFGGIVAANRIIAGETARQITEVFTEVVVAPGYTDEALEVLRSKKNLRILEIERPEGPDHPWALRSVSGGLLAQQADTAAEDESAWTVPTKAKPDDALLAELRFAWTAGKHVKSNAIVLARSRALVGVGAGQMSRVDSVRLAVEKSDGRHKGAVLASDAFFPFRDGPDAALDAGVVAMISPGGSVRDDEVVAACDERGVPMVFTGRRHFRH